MPPVYPAGSYPARVVADGASAYWRLNETTGTTAVDVIGGNNGTISGGVTLGQSGALADGDKAMAFNGTTGKIATSSMTIPTACTIELWVKTTASVTNNPLVAQRTLAGTTGKFLAYLTSGQFAIYSDEDATQFSTGAVNNGNWRHLVWTSTGTQTSLFVDGIKSIGPVTQAHSARTDVVHLAFSPDHNTFLLGTLDDVAIYPTALTPTQISAHYAARTWTAMPAWHDLRFRWCRYVQRPYRHPPPVRA